MAFIDWLEKRFARFAVPNLALMIIVGQATVYLLTVPQMQQAGQVPGLLQNISLIGSKVLDGQVWRVVTFVIDPPRGSIILVVIGWYVFYLLGTALEQTWGAFRFNLYLFVGCLATVMVAFIEPNAVITNHFLLSSVFLAFARLFPDFVFHLFFILPIKVKWLAVLQWATFAVLLLRGPALIRLMVAAAIINYVLFFWRDHYRRLTDRQRRRTFEAKVQAGQPGRLVHRCVVCGLSSEDEPKTAFRYCSQCAGQMCYCPEHIRNHEHVRDPVTKE